MAYTRTKITDLVDGNIDGETLHQMLSTPKDPDRFGTYIEILQERLSWRDKIVLPLAPKLYIVQMQASKQWKVRCECGHDFCDWRENWKLHAIMGRRSDRGSSGPWPNRVTWSGQLPAMPGCAANYPCSYRAFGRGCD